MSEYNPFTSPERFGDITGQNLSARDHEFYGGLRRFQFFILLNVGVQVIRLIAIAGPVVVLLTLPVLIIGAMALAYQRCLNIGMNPWWCLGLMVPILNIFVGLRCIAYPEGYEDHKTLDTPARIIQGIFVAAIGLIILVFVFAKAMPQ